ncbi:MAG: ATP synthase F1 subunit epsilon [Lachnospiraceae bacterium]|nr:ATP synthase F1 subunit epsilon [Lachnospiraceae bacterium]
MSNFKLSVLAADRPFYIGECSSLVLPTPEGQYGVLAHHSNTIAAVVPGLLEFTLPDGETRTAAVSEGMVKIEDNEVLILVDSAERPEDIDVSRAQRAAEEAREQLLQQKSIIEYRAAEAYLARALNRIKVGTRKRNR